MKTLRAFPCLCTAMAVLCGVIPSVRAENSETPGWTPTYPAGFDEQHTIATFGDSITAGSESHGDTCRAANFDGGSLLGKNVVLTYTYWLAKMVPSNFNVFGTARPEMVTDSILGWQGSVDLRLVDSVTLPKGGGTVACKVWFWDEASQSLKSSLNNKRNKGLEVPTSISGWVDGHHVTYVRDGKMHLYAKESVDVTLPAGAKFVPDFHYMYADSIQILFAGHNDGESSWEYNLAMLKKAVATIPSGRFIVVTSPCFTDKTRQAAFIKEFGADRYLDCYELLNTSGIQQAIDLGLLKQSELDHLTLKNGVYMLTDDLYYPGKTYPAWYVLLTGGTYSKPGPHMNARGHFIVAKALHEKLLKNGWITQAKHAKHTYAALSEANSVEPASATEKVSYPKACGDGLALRFCTAEGCAETLAEASHEKYPGGHAWEETSDECCNWLCDAKKSDVGHTHVYGAWTTNAAPTCVKSGTRSRSCTVDGCSETKSETLAALGHDYRETRRDAVKIYYGCTRCTSTKTELLDHTHTYGAWVTNPAPTCVETGCRTRTCTGEGCGETVEEVVPATGHVWIETQRQAGEIHYECANCPEVKMEFYDDPTDPQKPGDPDTSSVTYTWKGGANAAWGETSNWQADAEPSFGHPNSSAFATSDFAGDATVDLGGGSFSVTNLTMAAGANVTLASGTLANAATAIVSEGGSLTLRDITLTQNRISPGKDATLVLAGNCRLVTGTSGANGLRPFNKGGETIRVVDGESTLSSTATDGSCKSVGTLEIDNATLSVEAHFQIKNMNLSLRDGANRAARLAVGKNADVNFPKIDLVLPAAGWAEAPLTVGTTATVSSGIEIVVDATACTTAGTYPILSAGTLTLPEGGLADLVLNASCATGFTATLAASGNTLNLVLASGGEPEPQPHEHAYGKWTVVTPATCLVKGVEKRVCTAAGCTEPPAEETRDIAALGHAFGDWYETLAPQVGVAGEKRRDCTRTGCTAYETAPIDPLPGPEPDPEPMGADWGWSNRVTVAGVDYCVLAFTNTAASGFAWTVPADVTSIDYLVVGGGGGGGGSAATSYYGGGGGGAGAVVSGTASVASGDVLAALVGAGGAGGAKGTGTRGETGSASSLVKGSLGLASAAGGGGGGASSKNVNGLAGACGGGGGVSKGVGGTGNSGGVGGTATDLAKMTRAGGGGGAGGPGADGKSDSSGGEGGAGVDSEITGVSVTYAQGGKGGGWLEKTTVYVAARNGGDGTGNGGDGANDYYACSCSAQADGLGGKGGDGIVIVRYVCGDEPEPQPHEHAYGEWTVVTPATCLVKGVEKRVCTAAGCTEPPAEETRDIAALGHAFGDWYETLAPQVGVAGEKRRDCTRTGCTAYETVPVDPLPGPEPDPEPMGADWGWSNRVTVAGVDYCVLAFTNTAEKGFAWTVPTGVSAFRYLVVGGGGSGASGGKAASSTAGGGGGGAGGLREGDVLSAVAGSSYVIRVGAGGLAPTEVATDGGDGADSSISLNAETLVCARGGGGGGAGVYIDEVTTEGHSGRDGGCGGGAGGCNTNGAVVVSAPLGGAAVDAEAGFGGGSGSVRSPANNQSAGGGGGGAGAAGGKAAYNSPGAGGNGKVSDITGTDVCYAGGGGGAYGKSGTRAGGLGGGGTGGTTPTAGEDGLGGGGGGARGVGAGKGGDGIVIIRYACAGGPIPEKDPVVPGVEPKAYADEASARAAAPETITPPAEIQTALAADPAAQAYYVSCFEIVTSRKDSGQWVNEARLTEAADAELQRQVDVGAGSVIAALAEDSVTLESVTPGFYYALVYGETLDAMSKGASELAQANRLTLNLPKGASSGFYRVVVTVAP